MVSKKDAQFLKLFEKGNVVLFVVGILMMVLAYPIGTAYEQSILANSSQVIDHTTAKISAIPAETPGEENLKNLLMASNKSIFNLSKLLGNATYGFISLTFLIVGFILFSQWYVYKRLLRVLQASMRVKKELSWSETFSRDRMRLVGESLLSFGNRSSEG